MGALPVALARQLRDTYGLVRAVETGTYHGAGAAALAELFPAVETIELSWRNYLLARLRVRHRAVHFRRGDSRRLLRPSSVPTLYWLDAHWSGGGTAGKDVECPVLEEIAATQGGHPGDCYLIDDARLFVDPPPAPHDPAKWPSLEQLRSALLPRHVTLEGDVILARPP